MQQVETILAQARESITVKRVFGDPIERNGVTVIPVANVMGGGGGGSGEGPVGEGVTDVAAGPATQPMAGGSGGGFGMRATPAGVYVIEGDSVRWVPAFDLNRAILVGQIVAVLCLLIVRRLPRGRGRR
jgi:uncharacterized spore protein YtfJ